MCHVKTLRKIHKITEVGTLFKSKGYDNDKMNCPWIWHASSHDAAKVLKIVEPLLCVKAKEARLALKFMSLPMISRGGKGGSPKQPMAVLRKKYSMYVKMRRLKGRFRFDNKRFPVMPFKMFYDKYSRVGVLRRLRAGKLH
jgi:hypothetical protein